MLHRFDYTVHICHSSSTFALVKSYFHVFSFCASSGYFEKLAVCKFHTEHFLHVMRKLRLTEKFFQTNCAAENFIRLFVMNALNMPQQNSLYFKLGLTIWTGKIVTNSVHSFYVVFYSVRCLYPLQQESHPKLRS